MKLATILVFLGFMVLAVLAWCLPSSNLAISVYGLSILCAAFFVRKWVPIDKTFTDRLYHSLAVVAVALVFIFEAPGRQRLELHVNYLDADTQRGAQAQLANALDNDIARLNTLIQSLKQVPQGLPAAVRSAALQSRQAAQQEVDAICLEASKAVFEERRRAELNPAGASRQPELAGVWSADVQLRVCDTQQKRLDHPLRHQLENLQSLDELKPMGPALEQAPQLDSTLTVAGQRYTFSDLSKALNQPQSIIVLTTQRETAITQEQAFGNRLEVIKAQLKTAEDPGHFTRLDGVVGTLVKSGWPFLLIALLGLKLSVAEARPRQV